MVETIVNLKDSSYAHGFSENELIHREKFYAVMELIRRHKDAIEPDRIKEGKRPEHKHNTIAVFGERGTGKTSFLCSVLKEVESKEKDIAVLSIIDPTMIEEKEHIFLLVVSQINEAVKKRLNNDECRIGATTFQHRNMWEKKLQQLAKGLPTLEKIGADHKTREWQSHEFIMERGLDCVNSAFNLEHDFHQLVKYALEILGKKAFLLMLDDIDVDMQKGWDVLEMLRKYVTTPQIITLLSGNLKLYSLNVRKHQWKQLEENIKYEKERKDYSQTVNELEGQYLLKVLKPENRIHLNSLKENVVNSKHVYTISGYGDKDQTIQEVYKDILCGMGVKSMAQQKLFMDYLLSLSARTQIQLIKGMQNADGNPAEKIDAFMSRLYAANVNMNAATNNVLMLNLTIQNYLEEQKKMPDLYLLTPSSGDEDINACLTAFTILFTQESGKNPFLLFDYFIRMGYMRNVRLGLTDEMSEYFYSRTGLSQQMSLKNNVGLSQSYSYNNSALMESHTNLPGLAEKDKKGGEKKPGRIDYEVKEHGNRAQSTIAYLPLSVLRFTERNDTKVYYSFYSLMAVIADVLKAASGTEDKEALKAELMNLQVLRSYPTWARKDASNQEMATGDYTEQNFGEDLTAVIDTTDDTLDKLAESILTWAKEYTDPTPPYLMGKIATRIFYAIQKINEENLGEQMHREVVAYLNACLIEELREHYVKKEGKDSIDRLNTSNAITEDKVFVNNLDFVLRNDALDSIKMTRWMARCPLLWCFLNPHTFDDKNITKKAEGDKEEMENAFEAAYDMRLKVYNLLRLVFVKDGKKDAKPTFSGSSERFRETARILTEAGRDPKAIAEDTRDAEAVAEEVASYRIFSMKPSAKSITTFQSNYKKIIEEEQETVLSETLFGNEEENETGAATTPKKRTVKPAKTEE